MYEVETPEASVAAAGLGIGLAAVGLDVLLIAIVALTLITVLAVRLVRRRQDARD